MPRKMKLEGTQAAPTPPDGPYFGKAVPIPDPTGTGGNNAGLAELAARTEIPPQKFSHDKPRNAPSVRDITPQFSLPGPVEPQGHREGSTDQWRIEDRHRG